MAWILPAILPAVLMLAPEAEAPAKLFQYEVSESRKVTSPRGTAIESAGGTIVVSGGKARWSVTNGAFPRSSVSAVVAGSDGFVFLSRENQLAALGTRDDFDALFKGSPAADAGGLGNFTYSEIECQVSEKTKDGPSQLEKNAIWKIEARWVLRVLLPGRAVSIRNRVTGTLESSRKLTPATTPFDDPFRLLPIRGAAGEKVRKEIERIEGKIVAFNIEMTSEQTGTEGLTAGETSSTPSTPVRTTTVVERKTSGFLERPMAKAEAHLFEIPEDYKLRSPERILSLEPKLR
jgi:hypothetical protein